MTDLPLFIDAFSKLNVAKIKRHKAPHKAVLLLSIIDLVENGVIQQPRIELSDVLVDRFNSIWNRYLSQSDIFMPDITKPYFHMQHEPFWKLVGKHDTAAMLAAEESHWCKDRLDKKDLPSGGYSLKAMRNAFAYAEIDQALFDTMQNPDSRAMLRVTLINTYLVGQPTKTMPDLKTLIAAVLPFLSFVA